MKKNVCVISLQSAHQVQHRTIILINLSNKIKENGKGLGDPLNITELQNATNSSVPEVGASLVKAMNN